MTQEYERKSGETLPWLVFFAGILYSGAILLSLRYFHYSHFFLFWLIGILLVTPLYKSYSLIIESSILLLIWLLIRNKGTQYTIFLYLPLVAMILVSASYRIKSVFASWIILPITVLWLYIGKETPVISFNALQYFFLVTTLTELLILIYNKHSRSTITPHLLDVIVCSYSGNTAHYTNRFIEGAKNAGADVIVHRFHYYREFNPVLDGDSLVIAFPVAGWKPPWPMFEYLLIKLPRGNSKPAFVIYTAAGGPENAGIVAWFLLTLKGYRVMGRAWAMYPLNVVTFRIGPAGLWRFLDRQAPEEKEIETVAQTGKEFAQGRKTGLPFIFWPFPLVIAGLLLDNRWVNLFLYRNRVWKKRCISCGTCVSYCPAERLHMENGFPRAKGTCALCLGCINLCPKNAMHLLGWSEYGNPYKPRWPELLAKKRKTGDR